MTYTEGESLSFWRMQSQALAEVRRNPKKIPSWLACAESYVLHAESDRVRRQASKFMGRLTEMQQERSAACAS